MGKYKLPVSESAEQIALFQWAGLQTRKYPPLEWLYHIPNGGKRHITTAYRLKLEGVKAGVPDICLPFAAGGFHGLYIELKAGKNTATDNQSKWICYLQGNGYCAAVCHGWEAAARLIIEYLKGGIL